MQKTMLCCAAGLVGLLAGITMAGGREDDLTGEVALVTGGSRGLGLCISRELLGQGCLVAICARDVAELDWARHEFEKDGFEVLAIQADVTSSQDVERLVAEVTEKLGGIDILVNNAGLIQVAPLENTSEQDFEACMNSVFYGTLRPTLAVLPQMRQRGFGRIVNINSLGGRVALPHQAPYSAAKFANLGLSEGLRVELLREGIYVTAIAPGYIRTGAHLNVPYGGQPEREYEWFASSMGSPLLSMSAPVVARQVVTAMRRREAFRAIGMQAKLLGTLGALSPNLATALGAMMNSQLPEAGTEGAGTTGRALRVQGRAQETRTAGRLNEKAAEALQPPHRRA